jgi:hypothetical protein
VNDTVNGQIVNGVPMAPGTYGSSASGAANPGLAGVANPDDVFSGPGMLTVTSLAVVPEPGTLGLAGALLGGAALRRRRRR